ncbi:ankyrin repeat domain-containing protein [Candidatus Dependentiae bacterium]|nr:ankyrin repeat domain-containing protein [Candidatus Dependentiae bacterium]
MKKSLVYIALACTGALLLVLGKGNFFQKNNFDEPLFDAVRLGCVQTVQRCIDEGVDINVQDEDGWTPLSLARATGQEKVAAFLLVHGAQVPEASVLKETEELQALLESGYKEMIEAAKTST